MFPLDAKRANQPARRAAGLPTGRNVYQRRRSCRTFGLTVNQPNAASRLIFASFLSGMMRSMRFGRVHATHRSIFLINPRGA
jgi:hypothetical protein